MIAKTLQLFCFAAFSFPSVIRCVMLCAMHAAVCSTAEAQALRVPLPEQFAPSAELGGRVDFWRLVFTKYGQQQLVFHHRAHPEIIYSVLDFSDASQTRRGRDFERFKGKTIDEEILRIRACLESLASGKEPVSAFERRIERLFRETLGSGRKVYRQALEPEQIRFQTGIRERFGDGIRRSGRYLHALEAIFAEAGLPPELSRLPLVESSFDYRAYSSKGAAGIWQFTRSTGRLYMRVNAGIDERRDPIISTRAAARYLAHSYSKIQSWPLAITSYNHGLAGVLRGVRQTGSRDLAVIIRRYDGQSFGFASSNFYAEFVAALDIERNWKYYFPDLEKDPPYYFDEVRLDRSVSYRSLLSKTGTSDDEFYDHNLSFMPPVRKGKVTIPSGFLVKVDRGQGEKLALALNQGEVRHTYARKNTENQNVNVVRRESTASDTGSEAQEGYLVQSGETAGAIARKFGVSERELLAINMIANPRKLKAGQRLIIPEASTRVSTVGPQDSKSRPPSKSSPEVENGAYIVQRGDTMIEIAKKNGITLAALQKFNPAVGKRIFPGQKLVVR